MTLQEQRGEIVVEVTHNKHNRRQSKRITYKRIIIGSTLKSSTCWHRSPINCKRISSTIIKAQSMRLHRRIMLHRHSLPVLWAISSRNHQRYWHKNRKNNSSKWLALRQEESGHHSRRQHRLLKALQLNLAIARQRVPPNSNNKCPLQPLQTVAISSAHQTMSRWTWQRGHSTIWSKKASVFGRT